MKIKIIISTIIIITLGAATFKIYEVNGGAKSNVKSSASVQRGNIEYNVPNQTSVNDNVKVINDKSIDFVELQNKIQHYIDENYDKIGLVYYDINSETTIKFNENKEFKAASTVKVPINMYMYDLVNNGKIKLSDTIKYEKSDYEDGAGELNEDDLAKPISIQKLSDYSLIYSDNIATKMLIKELGDDDHYLYIENVVGHKIAHSGNYTTPMDSFKILERLYKNPDENPYYNYMVATLKSTIFHDRIDKYIPQNLCAHKIGDYESYVNDEAIIYGENPYILVIFTNDIDNADEFIANLSKIIYDEQNKKISR